MSAEITNAPKRAVYVPHIRVSLVRDGSSRTDARHARTPADAARILRDCMPEDTDREIFAVLLLDVRHKVIGFHVVSQGTATSTLVHPRDVYKVALLGNAVSLVACHNHPSGQAEPSAEDIALTRRLVSAGTLLGVELLDHVILGDGTGQYVSLKERGLV